MQTHSEAFLRNRKFLLVLPLLVLPFLTMAFWALGGGKGTAAMAPQATKGLNLQLPEPQLKEEKDNGKLGLYQQSRRKLQRQDNIGGKNFLHRLGLDSSREEVPDDAIGDAELDAPAEAPDDYVPGFLPAQQDPNEEKINERLAQLSQLVSQEPPRPQVRQEAITVRPTLALGGEERFGQDVAKLETMMRTMGGGNGVAADPEMRQLEGMLERILDVQHPERVKERLQQQLPETRQIFAMQAAPETPTVTLLVETPSTSNATATGRPPIHPPDSLPLQELAKNDFYSIGAAQNTPEAAGNSVEAAVHETQTLTAGAIVKLRLLQDAYVGGRLLPTGSLLYGTCQVRGERLAIEVTSFRSGNALLPVNLSAYDLDGLEGLHIPGSPARDAARQGTSRAVSQSLSLSSLSPSLGAQAAGAGIEAAKGLLSRQARQVKVTVKAGHRLLLRDQNARL